MSHAVPKQLHESLEDVLSVDREEVRKAVEEGYAMLDGFNQKVRKKGRDILAWCAREGQPCVLVLGRPYHMDTGIGHEIEVAIQSHGYPILWAQHFPIDEELMDWLFREEICAGRIRSPFDISDVWLTCPQ